MISEQYITLKEVAKILGVTPLTLRNWDKKGVLDAYRNYRVYRYADVADLIAEIRKTNSSKSRAIQKLRVVEEEA